METLIFPPSTVGKTPIDKEVPNTTNQQDAMASNKDAKFLREEKEKEEGPETRVAQFFQQVFGSCGGVVDVAALILQSPCSRGREAKSASEQRKFRLNLRRPYMAPGVKARRQGETLEFSTQGGFDDDVSAISAHTLDEMERIERVTKILKKKNSQTATPSPGTMKSSCTPPMREEEIDKNQAPLATPEVSWTYQVISRQTSNDSRSIGVSTSGSSDGHPEEEMAVEVIGPEAQTSYTRVVV